MSVMKSRTGAAAPASGAFEASAITEASHGVAPRGKFFHRQGERFLIKGVTHGTFAPVPSRGQFPPAHRVAEDFAAIAAAGINTVRLYTVPPPELLDDAARAGLRVMVGIPWAQHVPFLDHRR